MGEEGEKVRYAEWESEKSGLKVGFVPENISPEELDEEELRKFYLVFTRTQAGEIQRINGFIRKGFQLSDTYIVVRGKIKNLISSVEEVEHNGKVENIEFFTDIKSSGIEKNELIKKVIDNLKDARYFREFPEEIARKMYEAWIEDILENGIYVIAVGSKRNEEERIDGENIKDGKNIYGFGGYKIVEYDDVKSKDENREGKKKEGKFAIIFAEKFLSIHIIKRFIKIGIEKGIDTCEFKIRLKNSDFIRTYLNMIFKSSPKIDFEMVLSWKNRNYT